MVDDHVPVWTYIIIIIIIIIIQENQTKKNEDEYVLHKYFHRVLFRNLYLVLFVMVFFHFQSLNYDYFVRLNSILIIINQEFISILPLSFSSGTSDDLTTTKRPLLSPDDTEPR